MRIIPLSLALCLLFPVLAFCQHDGARDSVRKIASGSFESVEKILADKKPYAGEAESSFIRMLSLLAQDDAPAALEHARQAVTAGLPFSRLVVGPREQLQKLHRLPEFQSWKEQENPSSLIHGPMLGSVTATGAKFWVRTDGPKDVTVTIGNQRAIGSTSTDADFTAVISVEGLAPSSQQNYRVVIDNEDVAAGQFRTFASSDSPAQFSVGFGGGAGFVPEWEYMWDTIGGFKPNAFLMLGDNVYIDQPEQSLTNHYCYYRRQSRPEWRRFTAGTPIFSIWDDHDFGTNDCVPGPEIESPSWKKPVWKIFQQNWANPGYGGGEKQPGCWYDFRISDVHFIMLDGRFYRDLKGKTMLGPEQKEWLLRTLSESDATFKVIASPVPFTAGIKQGSKDPWDGFPEEREQIFQFIETERIEGVFLIAADRHRTDLRITKRPQAYDLYEFESSRLTNHHTHKVVETDGLVWGYNDTCSFALMTFDTTADDPSVKFECINIDGVKQYDYQLHRSDLEFK